MKLYGVENRRVIDSPSAPYPSLFDKFIVNNSEISTGGGDNLTIFFNANPMSTMDTSMITTSTLIPNLIVNNSALLTGGWVGGWEGGGYQTVSHNTIIMATSTNAMDTSTYMDDDNLSIMIHASFKAPRSGPGTTTDALSFSPKV